MNRTIRSVEEHIRDSLLKEIMSTKSTKGLQIDLSTLEIKRSLDADVLKSASFIREMVNKFESIREYNLFILMLLYIE